MVTWLAFGFGWACGFVAGMFAVLWFFTAAARSLRKEL
jgi:hypothetical protein